LLRGVTRHIVYARRHDPPREARRRRSLTISSAALGITLHYRSFAQITDDIADARIYGGIHFRFDQDEAADQGRRVGEYVYRHVLGRRRNGDGDERSHSR